MRRVGRGRRTALLSTLVESEERRKQAASGWLFFWLLFFGQAKKSNSPAGAKIGIKTSVATATFQIKLKSSQQIRNRLQAKQNLT